MSRAESLINMRPIEWGDNALAQLFGTRAIAYPTDTIASVQFAAGTEPFAFPIRPDQIKQTDPRFVPSVPGPGTGVKPPSIPSGSGSGSSGSSGNVWETINKIYEALSPIPGYSLPGTAIQAAAGKGEAEAYIDKVIRNGGIVLVGIVVLALGLYALVK